MRKASMEVWIFMVGTIGLTILFLSSSNTILHALSQALPMLVAIIVVVFAKRQGKWKELGIFGIGTWIGYVWMVVVVLLLVVSFLAAWGLGVVQLPAITKMAMTQGDRVLFVAKIYFSFGFLLGPIVFALGEEIGWRGYLQTRLIHKIGTQKALWMTAICWAIFHVPFFLLVDYTETGSMWVNLLLFTIMIFPLSYLLGWIRIVSDSIWPVVWCHALINHIRGFLATLFYVKQPYWTYITGENGVITIVAWVFFAWMVHRWVQTKRNSLSVGGLG